MKRAIESLQHPSCIIHGTYMRTLVRELSVQIRLVATVGTTVDKENDLRSFETTHSVAIPNYLPQVSLRSTSLTIGRDTLSSW